MKILLPLLFLLFFSAPKSYGQNVDKSIQSKWLDLNLILTKRASKFLELSNELIKADTAKEDLFIEARFVGTEFSNYLDTLKNINSKEINVVYKKNENITQLLQKILVQMEKDRNAKIMAFFFIFIPQFESIEKKLKLAIDNYNKACKANKKLNLRFENPTTHKVINVKF
jgi:hypothetical protein